MDATEAQLRFGASLTHSTDPSHPLHPLHLNPAQPAATATLGGLNVSQSRTRLIDPNATHSGNTTRIVGFSSNPDNQRNFDRDNYAQSSRREFLTYALSLMRSHSSEHRDSLPVLDITALRHIAYVVDGIVFYMRSGKENEDKSDNNYWADPDENENDDTEDELQMSCDNDSVDDDVLSTVPGSRHTFFQRSESTLCLGCPPPDPFITPMNEALPLADQPHLLQPNACREDLFGIPKQPVTVSANDSRGAFSPLELPPTRLGMSSAPRSAANQSQTLNTQYEPNFTYMDSGSEIPVQDEQSLSVEVEEKTEKNVRNNEDTEMLTKQTDSLSSSSSSSQSAPVPSTSKDQSTRRQPESFNIYMQLKKKTYFDFHDEDTKSNADTEKRDEGPQDLSCTKSNTESAASCTKMELDSDNELTDNESDGRSQSSMEHQQNQTDDVAGAGGGANIRPQIIVSPRKLTATNFAENETQKSETTNESNTEHLFNETSVASAASLITGANDNATNSPVIAQNNSNSSSPSKSVIVRAGPSVSIFMRIYNL